MTTTLGTSYLTYIITTKMTPQGVKDFIKRVCLLNYKPGDDVTSNQFKVQTDELSLKDRSRIMRALSDYQDPNIPYLSSDYNMMYIQYLYYYN